MDNKTFYDELSTVYDIMFPYASQQARVAFLDRIFTERGVKTVLDCGCGTGRQAIELSLRGFSVTGADISASMLERALENALANGLTITLIESDFASLGEKAPARYGGVYCIGNSLPHVADAQELRASLKGMVTALEDAGVLVLHLRNYSKVLEQSERLMPTLSGTHQSKEFIFQRIVDFLPDGRLNFSILTLERSGTGAWTPSLTTTTQYPATLSEIEGILIELGMLHITAYADFTGTPYAQAGENLIIVARKPPLA